MGTGLILAEESGLADVANLGLFRVNVTDTVTVTGSALTNNGAIEIGPGAGATTTLNFDADVTLAGTGEVYMRDSAATISTGPTFTLTQSAGHTIHGRGIISAAMVNNGDVRSDYGSGYLLRLNTEDKTNNGTFEATSGARMEIETVTVNNAAGTLLADDGEINLELGATIVGEFDEILVEAEPVQLGDVTIRPRIAVEVTYSASAVVVEVVPFPVQPAVEVPLPTLPLSAPEGVEEKSDPDARERSGAEPSDPNVSAAPSALAEVPAGAMCGAGAAGLLPLSLFGMLWLMFRTRFAPRPRARLSSRVGYASISAWTGD